MEGDQIFITRLYLEEIIGRQDETHLWAMGSMAMKLAAAAHKAKGAQSLEESVPEHYLRDFRGVFKKKDFDKLPEH